MIRLVGVRSSRSSTRFHEVPRSTSIRLSSREEHRLPSRPNLDLRRVVSNDPRRCSLVLLRGIPTRIRRESRDHWSFLQGCSCQSRSRDYNTTLYALSRLSRNAHSANKQHRSLIPLASLPIPYRHVAKLNDRSALVNLLIPMRVRVRLSHLSLSSRIPHARRRHTLSHTHARRHAYLVRSSVQFIASTMINLRSSKAS